MPLWTFLKTEWAVTAISYQCNKLIAGIIGPLEGLVKILKLSIQKSDLYLQIATTYEIWGCCTTFDIFKPASL
jgi:hypothetical protein